MNVTGTSVNLTWIEPFNGNSGILKYAVKLSDARTNETFIESPSPAVNASISGLRPDTAFRAEVYALNEVGWSQASNAIFFRTEEAAPSGAPVAVVATPTGPNSIKITWKVISCPLFLSPVSLSRVPHVPLLSLLLRLFSPRHRFCCLSHSFPSLGTPAVVLLIRRQRKGTGMGK